MIYLKLATCWENACSWLFQRTLEPFVGAVVEITVGAIVGVVVRTVVVMTLTTTQNSRSGPWKRASEPKELPRQVRDGFCDSHGKSERNVMNGTNLAEAFRLEAQCDTRNTDHGNEVVAF